ncbi:hypothetical protein TRFO_36795 [Tritrichomonas foetus]|uniref:Uncharacterized protein n=1 Tax=Tritrichomonas foetus TaxID=1144522 RepID=A0A1J4JCY4_9EUKA|nr:hypothetical protein TRFO_36795 [Tritrichomonas foetus]|eukprot:OHS97046.1 hypothetical protein TRFO_36795 [Tritrichomonas foetus]
MKGENGERLSVIINSINLCFMLSSHDDDNNFNHETIRRNSRLEKTKKDEIFTLLPPDFDRYLAQLASNDPNLVTEAIFTFSRHYLYNRFEYNDNTHQIIIAAKNFISESQIQPLVNASFMFLSHIVQRPLNGLGFLLQLDFLDIFLTHLTNIKSPYFYLSLLSVKCVVGQSPQVCEIVYKKIELKLLVDIILNHPSNLNLDIHWLIFCILYYMIIYVELISEENIHNIVIACSFALNQNYSNIHAKRISIRIIEKLFYKSATYHETEYASSFMNMFNYLLSLNTGPVSQTNKEKQKTIENNCQIISSVLIAYLPLLELGTATKENGIDIIKVIQLLSVVHNHIQINALDCIRYFIRAKPEKISFLIQNQLILKLHLIFERFSFNAKEKALEIVSLIMTYGNENDKSFLLNPFYTVTVVNLAKEGKKQVFLECINILNAMFMAEESSGRDLGIRSSFLEVDGVLLIDENTGSDDEQVAEATLQFFNFHFNKDDV